MKAFAKRAFLVLMLLALLALSSVALISCGGGGLGVGDVTLTNPANITYDGALIKWDAVSGAEGYYISIDGATTISEQALSNPVFAYGSTAEFTVSVKAYATNKKGETVVTDATTVNFKPLAQVTDLTVTEYGTLSWTPVEFATGYEVRIDGTEVIKINTCEFTEIKAGPHNYSVRPVVDAAGTSLYFSSWSAPKAVNKLATVAVDKIVYKDGYLQWTSISKADSYQVTINGVVVEETNSGSRYAYDAQNANFDVQIRANGNGSSTFNGDVCEVKRFVYLNPVTEINVVDGKLLWEPVDGATGYQVKINDTVLNQTFKPDACVFDGLSTGVSNRVQIIPTSDDTVYFSNWSTERNIRILSKPQLKWNNEYALDGAANNNIYWDTVDGAGGYTIRLTRPDGSTEDFQYGETQRAFAEAYLTPGTYKVQLQAQPAALATDVYPSSYSQAIEVVRLASPKAADQNFIISNPKNLNEGFTVTFQGVPGANIYKLYKDGGEELLSSGSSQFRVGTASFIDNSSTLEKKYNFYVRAMGNSTLTNNRVVLDSLTDGATSVQITVLATPQNMQMEGFILNYGTVAGNAGYSIAVNSTSNGFTSSSQQFDLGGVLQAGTYNVSVCAMGNGSNVLASNYTPTLNVVRLEAPTNVRIGTQDAEEGKLLFSEVLHALSYQVVFNNDANNAVPVAELNNINQRITTEGTTVYMQAIANVYNTDNTVYYMTSKPGTTTTFIKLAAPTWAEKKTNGNQLLWVGSSNAQTQSFTPNYRVADNAGTVYSGEFAGTTMNLANLAGGQDYTFKVQAIGDGIKFINSDYSDPISIYKIASPKVTVVDNAYTWRGVSSAVSYAVYVDGVIRSTEVHQVGDTYTFLPGFTEANKTYKVEVIALGDGGVTLMDATPTVINQKTKQLETPEFSFAYSNPAGFVTNGTIDVTVTKESPYALGYIFTIGGTDHVELGVSAYSFNPNGVGTYKIAVTAIGGGFDETAEYYYVQSQVAGGNERTQIHILDSVNPGSMNINMDGRLTWTTISGASGYILEIMVDGAPLEKIEVNANVAGIELSAYGVTYVSGVTQVIVSIKTKGNGNNTITSVEATATWPR